MSPAKRAASAAQANPVEVLAGRLSRAVARGVPVTVRTRGGGSYGPARVREKVSRLPIRDGTTVGVRLEGQADAIHLADVAEIEVAS